MTDSPNLRQQIAAAGSDLLAMWDLLPPGPAGNAIDLARAANDEVPDVLNATDQPRANGRLINAILQDLITYGPQFAALIQALIAAFGMLLVLALTPRGAIAAENLASTSRPGMHVDLAGRAHRVGGLKPLTAMAYHRLAAAAANPPAPPPAPLPIKTVDLRAKCPAVLDQNGYNCCAGCSGTMGHRLAEIIAGNADPLDSVADLYDRCNGGVDEGADLADCVAAMQADGVAPSSLVPNWQIPIEAKIPGVDAARLANPLEGATFLPNQAALLAALQAGTPVYYGIIVTNRFNPDAHGYIGPYGGIAEGGHAVLGLGVSATSNGYAIITRNSWGSDWGDHGNCLLDSSWAQPEVYGAFALSGRNRNQGKLSITGGTTNVVEAVYYSPDAAHLPKAAIDLAGSASSSLTLATWTMSDSALNTALCKAATSGRTVQVAWDVSANTASLSQILAKKLVSSGGSAWNCNFPPHIANNFLTADDAYTLTGNYYFSPTAVQIGSYLVAVRGKPAAETAAATFAALIASGTPVTAWLEPPQTEKLVECQCPNCAGNACPYLPPPPPIPPLPAACTPTDKPREVLIDAFGVHFDWKSQPPRRPAALRRRRWFRRG